MRKTISASLVFVLFASVTGLSRADDAADARAIIDKAIKAAGGEEKLAKFKVQTFKETGKYYGGGNEFPYKGSFAVQFPGKFKMEIEGVFTLVFNEDKGWMKFGDQLMDLTGDALESQKIERHAGWVATLIPLKDAAFTLAPLGETKVEDRPAVGVKVTRTGQPEIKLYFDKENGLLVKGEYRGKAEESPGAGFKDVNVEAFFKEYKEVEGVKVPMKHIVKHDGKVLVDAEIEDLKTHDKLEDSVFAKP